MPRLGPSFCVLLISILVLTTGCTGNEKEPRPVSVSDIWDTPAEPARRPDSEGAADATAARTNEPDSAGVTHNPSQAPEPATFDSTSNDPIAVVNGTPIDRHEFIDSLLQAHGLQLLERRIMLVAAHQRLAEMSLTLTRDDIAREHERALQRLATPIADPDAPPLPEDEARRLRDQFLEAKNISRLEWDWRIEQLACLRKIAEKEVAESPMDEDDLKNEYELLYGERVQIRHIQVGSLGSATRVRALLAAGRSFADVAREMSDNPLTAPQGGLVRPFTRKDPALSPLMSDAAFALGVGDISEPIRDGNVYHIIRLERRDPARGPGFTRADRDELRRNRQRRLVDQRQDALETELFRSAVVDIKHEELARQFRERR